MSRLMKKVRSLAAVVAGMLVFGANAGTFLNDLAMNANKVVSSEYATGGDVILKLDDYTWVHVFTNAAASATFTANQPLGAQVLLVAGGGGGASGYYGQAAGGGAGGMVEDTAVTFASGVDYTVTVGKGGDGTKGNDVKHGGQGGNSSITGGALAVEAAAAAAFTMAIRCPIRSRAATAVRAAARAVPESRAEQVVSRSRGRAMRAAHAMR